MRKVIFAMDTTSIVCNKNLRPDGPDPFGRSSMREGRNIIYARRDHFNITYEEVKPITDPSGKSPDLKIAGLGQRRRSPLEQEPVVERTEEELQPIQWEYLSKHDVPISKIEAELEKLVTQMKRILPRLDSETAEQSQTSPEQTNRNHRFALYEIALHVEINAEGSLSILGTGGKLGGKGGMQLTFKRS